ncbi:MAG: hypothetical protein IKF49_05215, partial [Clostridia bacterium]|nr:hypothetical protein [Clostridia bacterium]
VFVEAVGAGSVEEAAQIIKARSSGGKQKNKEILHRGDVRVFDAGIEVFSYKCICTAFMSQSAIMMTE